MNAPLANEEIAWKQVRAAADWFYWIVGITLLVMLYAFMGGQNVAPLGLATPILLASQIGPDKLHSLLLVASIAVVLLVFILLGDAASDGSRNAFALGTLLYLADTILMFGYYTAESAPFQHYAGIFTHVITFSAITFGWMASNRLAEIVRSRSNVRSAEASTLQPADSAPVIDTPDI